MNCPDCDFEMESENQSWSTYDQKGRQKMVAVSVRYFCPNCKEYWRWEKNRRGLSRA